MAILFAWPEGDAEFWHRTMETVLGPVEFRVFPDDGDRSGIEYALVWRHPVGDLATYPNLKGIFSLGAGVPYVLQDQDLPDVPLVRFQHPELTRDMVQYVIHWVLHFQRGFHRYKDQQAEANWTRHLYAGAQNSRVAMLGLGGIGGMAATTLASMGFNVAGWGRTERTLEGVETHAGPDGLDAALDGAGYVVSVLPGTPSLVGVLDRARLGRLAPGAFLINLGRGENLVDADLLALLDSGHLAGAVLDVFRTEPLPTGDPYWSHPKVHVTPHIAGPSTNDWAPIVVAENIKRMQKGEAPFPIVERASG
jgi:glyoxylate/hydroxypyruvate reductase A